MIITNALNPIRFTGSLEYEFTHNEAKCYSQKYNLSDHTKIQVLSDDGAPEMQVMDAETGFPISTISFDLVADNLVVNDDFKIYEAEIVFFNIGVRKIYLRFNQLQKSPVIDIQENHEGTVLLKYRNSRNDFGVVFDTGIVFYTRIEGTVKDLEPQSDNEIYTDQIHNITKLYSQPYNMFTFYAGKSYGLPDFMLDLVNRIFSCDMIKIDNTWFERSEGSEFEVVRVDGYPFAGMSINVQPAVNRVLEQIRVDEGEINPDENMIIQRNASNYFNITGSASVSEIFNKNTCLNYIKVYRRMEPFVMRVGITPGGNEIAEVEIDQLMQTISLNYMFNGDATVYISGMTGDNDVSLVWEKLDVFFNPEGAGTDPTPTPSGGGLKKGAVIEWHGTPEEMQSQWNLVTGLGYETGDWVGWSICNNQNGTPNCGGRVTVGYQNGHTMFGTIGLTAGVEEVALTPSQLPRHNLKLNMRYMGYRHGDKGTRYTPIGEISPDIDSERDGYTDYIGNDEAHTNMQPYIVLLKIKKIV